MQNEPPESKGNIELERVKGVTHIRDFASDSDLVQTLNKFGDFEIFNKQKGKESYLLFNSSGVPYLMYATTMVNEKYPHIVAVVSESRGRNLQVLEDFKAATGVEFREESKFKDLLVVSGMHAGLIEVFYQRSREHNI